MTRKHSRSTSLTGNGLRLVDTIHLSGVRELRAYVRFNNWCPSAIEIRLHDKTVKLNFRGSDSTQKTPFGFRPVHVPLDHVADLQSLLARAYRCALQPLKETTPYAEES